MIKIAAYIENTYQCFEDDLGIKGTSLSLIPWSDWFQTWLEEMHPNVPPGNNYELSLRLTSDREIETFNAQYRHKDQATDVLAFAALESEVPQPEDLDEPLYLGDIIISLDTANQQAQERQHSLIEEIAWLATHGFLHILGWDHPDDMSLEKMLAKQGELMKIILIPN